MSDIFRLVGRFFGFSEGSEEEGAPNTNGTGSRAPEQTSGYFHGAQLKDLLAVSLLPIFPLAMFLKPSAPDAPSAPPPAGPPPAGPQEPNLTTVTEQFRAAYTEQFRRLGANRAEDVNTLASYFAEWGIDHWSKLSESEKASQTNAGGLSQDIIERAQKAFSDAGRTTFSQQRIQQLLKIARVFAWVKVNEGTVAANGFDATDNRAREIIRIWNGFSYEVKNGKFGYKGGPVPESFLAYMKEFAASGKDPFGIFRPEPAVQPEQQLETAGPAAHPAAQPATQAAPPPYEIVQVNVFEHLSSAWKSATERMVQHIQTVYGFRNKPFAVLENLARIVLFRWLISHPENGPVQISGAFPNNEFIERILRQFEDRKTAVAYNLPSREKQELDINQLEEQIRDLLIGKHLPRQDADYIARLAFLAFNGPGFQNRDFSKFVLFPIYIDLLVNDLAPLKIAELDEVWKKMSYTLQRAFGEEENGDSYPKLFVDFMLGVAREVGDLNRYFAKEEPLPASSFVSWSLPYRSRVLSMSPALNNYPLVLKALATYLANEHDLQGIREGRAALPSVTSQREPAVSVPPPAAPVQSGRHQKPKTRLVLGEDLSWQRVPVPSTPRRPRSAAPRHAQAPSSETVSLAATSRRDRSQPAQEPYRVLRTRPFAQLYGILSHDTQYMAAIDDVLHRMTNDFDSSDIPAIARIIEFRWLLKGRLIEQPDAQFIREQATVLFRDSFLRQFRDAQDEVHTETGLRSRIGSAVSFEIGDETERSYLGRLAVLAFKEPFFSKHDGLFRVPRIFIHLFIDEYARPKLKELREIWEKTPPALKEAFGAKQSDRYPSVFMYPPLFIEFMLTVAEHGYGDINHYFKGGMPENVDYYYSPAIAQDMKRIKGKLLEEHPGLAQYPLVLRALIRQRLAAGEQPSAEASSPSQAVAPVDQTAPARIETTTQAAPAVPAAPTPPAAEPEAGASARTSAEIQRLREIVSSRIEEFNTSVGLRIPEFDSVKSMLEKAVHSSSNPLFDYARQFLWLSDRGKYYFIQLAIDSFAHEARQAFITGKIPGDFHNFFNDIFRYRYSLRNRDVRKKIEADAAKMALRKQERATKEVSDRVNLQSVRAHNGSRLTNNDLISAAVDVWGMLEPAQQSWFVSQTISTLVAHPGSLPPAFVEWFIKFIAPEILLGRTPQGGATPAAQGGHGAGGQAVGGGARSPRSTASSQTQGVPETSVPEEESASTVRGVFDPEEVSTGGGWAPMDSSPVTAGASILFGRQRQAAHRPATYTARPATASRPMIFARPAVPTVSAF